MSVLLNRGKTNDDEEVTGVAVIEENGQHGEKDEGD